MKKLLSIFTISLLSVCVFAHDIIVTKKAQKIEAKILEVSTSEIRYKELDNLDGPIFILKTEEINSITYANGKVVIYNQPASDEDLARERSRREASSRLQAEQEQRDIEELDGFRQEEEIARRQAEQSRKQQEERAVAKATQMGSLFGSSSDIGTGSIVGSGSGHGNSWSLAGRSIKGTMPSPSNNFTQEGRVVVQIRVSKAGDVVNAVVVNGTTVTDKKTQQIAIDAAKKTKFTEGDQEQVGTITYIFKLN